ncbi:MAG: heavy metal translocating P-type ATPase [Conchiformibius sp.]|nr:heavy metal translocating P-type ATPase [Conchiformibius sp.]
MSAENTVFRIEGMSCQACAVRIEKVLAKKEFVEEVRVNFADESAHIRYDAAQTDADALAQIIEKAGFRALPQDAALPPDSAAKHWRVWVLLVLTLPFATGMAGMLVGSHALMPPLALQVALATAAQLYFALPFYRSAYAALRGGAANMDVLVSLGTVAIYLYSLLMAAYGGEVYFEAGVMVLAFVSLGKYWEGQTKRHSLNSLNLLMQLMPQQAEVWRDGTWQKISADGVKSGERLRTVHGGRIAADGTVLSGEAWADESHLTGESLPVAKRVGSRVLAGTLLSGSLEYRADAVGRATRLADTAQALAEAQGSQAPIARTADRVAAVFVPAVLAVSLLTFAANWLFTGSASAALVRAVAVLVAACPCALGLATPAAVMAGIGVAARHGIRFKNAAVLERAGQVDTVMFDKTGTLTEGRPQIAAVWHTGDETLLLQASAAVEQHSLHPLATALVEAARERGLTLPQAAAVQTEAGQGLSAQVDGMGLVRVGTPEFCTFRLPETLFEETAWQSAAIVAVALNGRALGAFALSDRAVADAADAVARLYADGMDIGLISGDRAAAVAATAAELGIRRFEGGVLPRDKAAAVTRLREQGRVVAMVGDGINDAPALAAADVGIAVWGSTGVAEHGASVLLGQASLQCAADALAIARATLRTIRQNLFFAFFYNVLAIPLAACGLLTPALAGLAMAFSSVSVLANALRLKHYRL